MSNQQSSAPIQENKMGIMPIGKLVFNMSLPMMVSMMLTVYLSQNYRRML